jgi:hypothetical protein
MMDESEDKYTISWYDAEQTILLCDVTERWSWQETHAIIQQMNDWVSTVQHGVYTIFHLQHKATLLPQGRIAMSDVRRIIDTQHPNDELIFFIGASTLVTSLVNIAGQVYKMRDIISQFRFVYSMEEALTEIAQHKVEKASQPSSNKPI